MNLIITTARVVCGRVCVTVWRPSVCPVYIDRSSSVRRVCCWAPRGQEISIDSTTAHSRTAFCNKREQCHVVSRRRKLNTDLLEPEMELGRIL